ncbi:MAG: IclR family transcriptional regulator [Candidatus Rokubacteria bacterium]|nr:IclR family transcriptional regulator [Candidatus Rokubacteria bacterium]
MTFAIRVEYKAFIITHRNGAFHPMELGRVGRLNSPILKAVRILLQVVQEAAPISLADLSAAVGFPKPTVHRLALLLEQEGLLQKDPLSRRYLVGSALEGLAFNAIRNAPGHSIRRFHMQRLSEKIGESINLGALSGDEVVYVERVESAWPLRMDFKPGSRVPIHCTANGKLLLAYSPPSVRQRILRAAPFPACAKNTLTTAAQLSRELDAIRRRGYSEDNEEFLAGVCCVAVPIRNGKREVIAGLAVMAPSARFPLEKARSYLPDLYATAEAISAQWGSVERSPPARANAIPVAEVARGPKPGNRRGEKT